MKPYKITRLLHITSPVLGQLKLTLSQVLANYQVDRCMKKKTPTDQSSEKASGGSGKGQMLKSVVGWVIACRPLTSDSHATRQVSTQYEKPPF